MKIYFQVVMLLGMVDKKLYNGTEVLSLNLNSIINLLITVINVRYLVTHLRSSSFLNLISLPLI